MTGASLSRTPEPPENVRVTIPGFERAERFAAPVGCGFSQPVLQFKFRIRSASGMTLLELEL